MDVRQLNKKLWPFQIELRIKEARSSIDGWCSINLGKQSTEWFSYGNGSKTTYAFKDESTLLVFRLTWGDYEL